MIRFLETISYIGDDVLIPIDRIKLIWCGYGGHDGNSLCIRIITDEDKWEEYFEHDNEKCNRRYDQIKKILNGSTNEVRNVVKKAKKT